MKRTLLSLVLALGLAAPLLAPAQESGDAPLVTAPKIVEALTKDVVIDQPGAAARPRRDPSISLQVQFTFGSAELTPHGKRQLDELAMALSEQALAASSFQLAGHTDAVGGQDANMRLSLGRADAVKAYLIEAHGVAASRLQTIGYGPTRLAEPGRPNAAVNRRVEVVRLAGAPQRTGGRLVPTPR